MKLWVVVCSSIDGLRYWLMIKRCSRTLTWSHLRLFCLIFIADRLISNPRRSSRSNTLSCILSDTLWKILVTSNPILPIRIPSYPSNLHRLIESRPTLWNVLTSFCVADCAPFWRRLYPPLMGQGSYTTSLIQNVTLRSDDRLTSRVDEFNGIAHAGMSTGYGRHQSGVPTLIEPVSFFWNYYILYLRGTESIAHILLELQCVDRPRHLCLTCTLNSLFPSIRSCIPGGQRHREKFVFNDNQDIVSQRVRRIILRARGM